MNTKFLLLAQYSGLAIIPVKMVVKDYFSHLTTENFVRKVSMGDIKIPLVRMEENSQKAAKGVHINDLAEYIEGRHVAALKEAQQMASKGP